MSYRLVLLTVLTLMTGGARASGDDTGARVPETIPARHELPFTVRRGLPEARLTLWQVAEDPAHRWAKINGERLSEGGELESGLAVVRIRHDGVVCEYQGHRFLLTPN